LVIGNPAPVEIQGASTGRRGCAFISDYAALQFPLPARFSETLASMSSSSMALAEGSGTRLATRARVDGGVLGSIVSLRSVVTDAPEAC
jgi:hypothetical protein